MDFEKILELLPDYAQGTLSGAEEAAVRQAVAQSESLRTELAKLKAYYEAAGDLEEVKAPGDFVSKVNAKIDARKGLLGRVLLPVWPKVPLELAGLAVTIVLVIIVFNPFTLRNVPRELLGEQPVASAPTSAPSAVLDSEQEFEEVEEVGRSTAEPSDRAAGPRTAAPARQSRKPQATAPVASAAPRAPARPTPSAAPERQFAPEPQPSLAAGARSEEKRTAAAAGAAPSPQPSPAPPPSVAAAPAPPPPAPAASPKAEAEVAYAQDDVALERRKLKEEAEAVSVMTLAIDDRSIDRSDVDDRRSRKTRDEAGAAKAAAEQASSYPSVEEKAFSLVVAAVKRHGGTIRLRSRMEEPNPQRTYVVTLPPGSLDKVREEFKSLGVLKDIDLNLDASSAERVTFRLGVTVE